MRKKAVILSALFLLVMGQGAALSLGDIAFQVNTKLLGQEVYEPGEVDVDVEARPASVSQGGLPLFATIQDDTIYPGDTVTVCEEFYYESSSDGYLYENFWLEGDFENGPTPGDSYFTTIEMNTWDEVCIDFEAPSSTGTYSVRIDSSVQRRGYDASYTVEEEPPEPADARISVESRDLEPGEMVTFDGTGSTGDGTLDFYWYVDSDDNQVSTARTLTTSFQEEGRHTVFLEVIGEGGGDLTRVTVNVQAVDPEAGFTVSNDNVTFGRSVTLDASTSVEGTYPIQSYEWSAGNQTLAGETATYTPESDGSKRIRLQVTDSQGNTASASQTINVYDPSNPNPGIINQIIDFFRNLF